MSILFEPFVLGPMRIKNCFVFSASEDRSEALSMCCQSS